MFSHATIKFSLAMLFALPANLLLQAQDSTPRFNIPYPAALPINYVRTWDALSPVTDPIQLVVKPRKEVMQTTSYSDGLGRPLQTVIKQGSLISGASPTDLVNMKVYDEYGREVRSFLPYASTDTKGVIKFGPFEQQQLFYNSNNANSPISGQGETFFYGKTEYEPSPLNRVDRAYAPGNSWVNQGKGIQVKYLNNTGADEVRIWNVSDVNNDFGTYSSPGNYPAATLFKTITIDEHNNQVIEFKTKEGLVVLKKVQVKTTTFDNGSGSGHGDWLCTYYLYDDYNQLRAVVQPAGVDWLRQNGWGLTSEILKEQVFRYEYDQRNRMIMKKVPGAEPVQMVYDARDRLVMTQDAKMKMAAQMQWLVTKYDDINRPVATYLITDPANYLDAAWHRTQASASISYPNVSVYSNQLLTEIHYDNYDGIPTGLAGTLNASGYPTYLDAAASEFPDPLTPARSVLGLVTWTRTKVLGENTYISSCSIYDDKKRVIQVQSLNYTNALDIITSQYNFSGQLLRSHIKHQKGGTNPQTYDVATKNNYDNLGRLASVENNLNSGGWKKVVEITYDAIGQMKTKKLSPDFNGLGLEKMEYDYNIQGWMLGANRKYAKETNNIDHYFGFDLGYDKQTVGTLGSYGQPQFNGNITGTVWKSKGDGEIRKYDYSYDPANRITGADFNQYSSGFNKTAGVDFTVSNLTYDLNGNILTQKQMGLKGGSSASIDQLKYNYYDYSNRLKNVLDSGNDPQTMLGDFRSSQKYIAELGGGKTNQAVDYDQDENGNLKYDQNKDIESITYNHLNLPQTITIEGNKGSIEYVYDAAGTKLKKVVHETGKQDKTTLYLFGIYEDEVLQFLPMEEGRIRPMRDTNGAVTSFTYDYFVKDHLGNVRMVLTEEQKVDIYPAATLEGDFVANTGAVSTEKNFYNMQGTNIVLKNVATGLTEDYKNKNGGSGELDPPVNNNSNGNPTASSEKLYLLDASDGVGKTGLGITLKVMSGDRIDIYGKSYYFDNTAPNSYQVPVLDLLTGLLGAPTGATVGKAVTATGLSGVTDIYNGVNNFLTNPGRNNGTTTVPKAYINWVLLDDNFKYVNGNFDRVGGAGTLKNHLLSNIPVTRNGYLYVYVSNESPVKVFFDNLQVIHTKGPLLEETHYYPFGLTMAGISSKALKAQYYENKRGFNGNELQNKEFSDGSGLETYDFNARMYDPQIGRFFQIDPLSDLSVSLSQYNFSSNSPINRNDPSGLKDTIVNGQQVQRDKDLATVYVTGKKNPNSDNQSAGGRLWRNHVNHILKVPTRVSNLFELGANSMLRTNMIWLTDDLLERVKKDPAMVTHQQQIIKLLKTDPRFKKVLFIYSNTGASVQFGGNRATGEDWFGLSDQNPLLHSETWEVASDPLTWTLRHANIQTDAIIKEDGTIVMTHYISDKLDLRPGPGHTEAYNTVTSGLGPIYHDFFRGSDKMQVRGNWSTTINE
ncbi:hypothetical protein A4H97_18765 [Niastella yeongjuensis]|uniref:DUF6443 domain-containing protein n=1 Tax=Niastella yeongjuensis TaxID=354355 RepID=A0A1V9DY54_9BACT|nr:DUF6443 domain-containing protein [Niastella yeongjuensis]OQP38761.1 hypothetical protein A4H97_18765 [Niastella yeongjuensis]SEO33589.1 RHS repeat-associated core domain-containing protein [Niastella yeongjuensis]